MKKLATIALVCVLVGSFMAGAFVTDAQAKPFKIPDDCIRSMAPSICDLKTCKALDPYICNGKLRYFWTGEYCC